METNTTHEAPERIWVNRHNYWANPTHKDDKKEYVLKSHSDDLVQAAVAAERERCAKVAENLKVDDPHWQICGDLIVRRQVAAAIREGGTDD